MDDRMADSQMMGDIQADAFEDGFKAGKCKILEVLSKTQQFGCLESWCASRHEGKGGYCKNCRRLKELDNETTLN